MSNLPSRPIILLTCNPGQEPYCPVSGNLLILYLTCNERKWYNRAHEGQTSRRLHWQQSRRRHPPRGDRRLRRHHCMRPRPSRHCRMPAGVTYAARLRLLHAVRHPTAQGRRGVHQHKRHRNRPWDDSARTASSAKTRRTPTTHTPFAKRGSAPSSGTRRTTCASTEPQPALNAAPWRTSSSLRNGLNPFQSPPP